MITFSEKGEWLQVTIHRRFDFTIACKMQRECKFRVRNNGIKRITICLERVIESNSSAIGAVLMVNELVSGEFSLVLNECSELVDYLFGPNVLGRQMKKSQLTKSPPPSIYLNP